MTIPPWLAARIRAAGGDRVLAAIDSVPRELFVAPGDEPRAWEDRPLDIGSGQTISQPVLVARMVALLELGGAERVLDVGTGSGWHAAILARLCAHVWSIERHPELSARAAASLAAAGVENVTLIVGDGSRGWPPAAPYDAINVAAAAAGEVPPELLAQLGDGGRLLVPVGGEWQRLVLVRRRGAELERAELDPVRFVPLVRSGPPGAEQPG